MFYFSFHGDDDLCWKVDGHEGPCRSHQRQLLQVATLISANDEAAKKQNKKYLIKHLLDEAK